MKFSVVGVGPGDPELITLKAVRIIREADVVLIPHSMQEKISLAEQIVRLNISDVKTTPIIFPMLTNTKRLERILFEQIENISAFWKNDIKVAFATIGDATIYSTGSYLFDSLQNLVPDIELSFVPGISAHQLASSRLGRFLAIKNDVFSVIPCSKTREEILAALLKTDTASLYKPSMLKESLSEVVMQAGPWDRIARVDRAGMPEEKIYEGKAALEPVKDYFSILLLWRRDKGTSSLSRNFKGKIEKGELL